MTDKDKLLLNAAKENNLRQVSTLISAGAKTTAIIEQEENYRGYTAYHFAILNGNNDMVTILLTADENLKNLKIVDHYSNILDFAFELNNPEAFRSLIIRGAEPKLGGNIKPKNDIQWAIIESALPQLSKHPKFLGHLLHFAILQQSTFAIKLIEAGAKLELDYYPQSKSIYALSPIHIAIICKQYSTLKALLEHGASPDRQYQTQNNLMHSAIYLAINKSDITSLTLLINHKAKLSLPAFTKPRGKNQWACLNLLIESLEKKDDDPIYYGKLLLMAIKNLYLAIIPILLKRNADLSLRDKGLSALNWAIIKKNEEGVTLLLAAGAKSSSWCEIKKIGYANSLQLALTYSNNNIIELILKKNKKTADFTGFKAANNSIWQRLAKLCQRQELHISHASSVFIQAIREQKAEVIYSLVQKKPQYLLKKIGNKTLFEYAKSEKYTITQTIANALLYLLYHKNTLDQDTLTDIAKIPKLKNEMRLCIETHEMKKALLATLLDAEDHPLYIFFHIQRGMFKVNEKRGTLKKLRIMQKAFPLENDKQESLSNNNNNNDDDDDDSEHRHNTDDNSSALHAPLHEYSAPPKKWVVESGIEEENNDVNHQSIDDIQQQSKQYNSGYENRESNALSFLGKPPDKFVSIPEDNNMLLFFNHPTLVTEEFDPNDGLGTPAYLIDYAKSSKFY